MTVTVGWQLSLVNVLTGNAHPLLYFGSQAEAKRALQRYAADGYTGTVTRKDTLRRDPSRHTQERVRDRKGRVVLVDVTEVKPVRKDTVNSRFHRLSSEIGGDDREPARLKRASKRDLSASWSNSAAKVLRRGEADKAPPGRDVTQFDPAYQIERLEHNRAVQWRKLEKAVDRGDSVKGIKLIQVIGEHTARINMLKDKINAR